MAQFIGMADDEVSRLYKNPDGTIWQKTPRPEANRPRCKRYGRDVYPADSWVQWYEVLQGGTLRQVECSPPGPLVTPVNEALPDAQLPLDECVCCEFWKNSNCCYCAACGKQL